MNIEFHCNGEGDTYRYDVTPDGMVAKFVTKSGFVGICSGLYSERHGNGNIVFRIGFNVGNTISISESSIIGGISEQEICSVLSLFDEVFSELKDSDAEKKMIELVKYSGLACAINSLTSGKNVDEILKSLDKKKVKGLTETLHTVKEKEEPKKKKSKK